MALDFKKLSDPAYRAEARALREAEEARIEAEDNRNRGAVAACLNNIESLSEAERRFVRSVNTRLNTFGVLSEKQLSWLHDVAGRFGGDSPHER